MSIDSKQRRPGEVEVPVPVPRRGHQAQVQAEGRMSYLLRIIAADAWEGVRRGHWSFVRGRWEDGE